MENSNFVQNRTLDSLNIAAVPDDIRAMLAKLPFQTAYYVGRDFITPLYFPLWLFGMISNILNIIVYSKIGARDNVTVSFLALSISDLLYLVLLSPHLTVDALVHLVEYRMGRSIEWLFDYRILRYPFYWYAFTFYEVSMLINVYISVVRCACVAIPFSVKSMFTARRAIIAFIVFFISIFALRFPMFMTKTITQHFDTASNMTRFVYREIDDGGLADKINDIFNRNILTWTSFITVLICLTIMIIKLQASAKFRSSVFTKNPTTAVGNEGICSVQEQNQIKEVSGAFNYFDKANSKCNKFDGSINHRETFQVGHGKRLETKPRLESELKSSEGEKLSASAPGKGKQVLSSREAQVVRSVILVASIFVTCQTPFMAYSLARRIETQFDDVVKNGLSRYIFLFSLCSTISTIFALINASVNIVVYFNFNSRYRQCMKLLWKLN